MPGMVASAPVLYISSRESHLLAEMICNSRNISSCATLLRRLVPLLLALPQPTPTETLCSGNKIHSPANSYII